MELYSHSKQRGESGEVVVLVSAPPCGRESPSHSRGDLQPFIAPRLPDVDREHGPVLFKDAQYNACAHVAFSGRKEGAKGYGRQTLCYMVIVDR